MTVIIEFFVNVIGDVGVATYQGKKVSLNKPFRTPKEKKKFAVYVKTEVAKEQLCTRDRSTDSITTFTRRGNLGSP